LVRHLLEGAACRVTGRRALRRSTVAICYEASVLLGLDRRLSPHAIRAALAPPFIQTRPAIEGSPLIGCGRWPRFLGRGYESRLQDATPCSAN